mmetsp:Transcript_29106/g.32647  ORF Transcript_29106/g.32647 Transcript_29106/m.32647 type:complete len:127 (-) Transcript_29106:10-390(-)
MKLFPFTTGSSSSTTLFFAAVSLVVLIVQQQEPLLCVTAQKNQDNAAYADSPELNTTTTDAETVAAAANLENKGPDAIMIKNETIGNSESSDGTVSAASTTQSILVSIAACVVAVVYVAGAGRDYD